MGQKCSICNQKISWMDSYSTLRGTDGIDYTICMKCREHLSSEINSTEVQQYFADKIYRRDIVPALVEAIKIELDNAQNERMKEKNKQRDTLERTEVLEKQKLLTTGFSFEGYQIVSYHGLVSGSAVIGTGALSELSSGVADIFGAKSNVFSTKMTEAKNEAERILTQQALHVGGNAVIGIDFDYVLFNNNMIGVSANGTAVTVKRVVEEI